MGQIRKSYKSDAKMSQNVFLLTEEFQILGHTDKESA